MFIKNGIEVYSLKSSFPFLFFIIFISSVFAQEEDLLRAPVFSKNQFIASYGRLTPGNDFIDRDSRKSDFLLECGATNTITRIDKLDVDYESYNCNIYAETQIKGIRTAINTGLLRTGGGIFDSMIESYHQALSLPNGSRGRTPENRYAASGTTSNGSYFDILSTDVSVIDPQISLSLPVYKSEDLNEEIYFDLSTTLPLSSGRFALDSPDVKTSIVYLNKFSRSLNFMFGTSFVLYTDQNEHNINYPSSTLGAFGSVQYALNDSFSIYMQNVISQSLERDFLALYNYYWYLDIGFRFKAFKGQVFEYVLRENPSPGSGTADVSMFLRYVF